MTILNFRNIQPVKTKEFSTFILSCIASFLQASGKAVKLDLLLDIAPIPKLGVSDNLLKFIFKRIGISAKSVSSDEIRSGNFNFPILIKKKSGYFFIVLAEINDNYLLVLPGYKDHPISYPKVSDIFDDVDQAYVLSLLSYGPARYTFLKQAKLWLIPWCQEYEGIYDSALVAQSDEILQRERHQCCDAEPLESFSCAALLDSHRSICTSAPLFYGHYRNINLKRGCLFVDFSMVQVALTSLLDVVTKSKPCNMEERVFFAAKLLTDFLTIHPYHNANRRMGMLLVSKYLKQWGYDLAWSGISCAEIYYWTRCASRGHFQPMANGFLKNLVIH